ncbi:MAG: hypothetical protein ACMV1D_09145 [Macromonas sp.]
MAQILKNNVSGVLGLALSASGTSMTLLDASNFPTPTGGDFYLLTLIGLNANGQEASWEVVKVTAKASNTLTIVRAQEGTAAAAWPVATTVQLRLTAGSVVTPGTVSDHVGSGGSAHAAATTSTAGFMSAADKTKLDGVATNANNYSHPTGDGNLHVPATGTTNNGKVLKAGSTANSAAWGSVAYSEVTGTPTIGTAAAKDVPATGNASTAQVVMGSDTRLSDARTPTAHSHAISDVTGLQTALGDKQVTLVSGTNIKTVNGQSLLGSGDIPIVRVSLDGPLEIFPTEVKTYTITDYSVFSTYAVSATAGTVSIAGNQITYTAPATAGAVTITVTRDGAASLFPLEIQEPPSYIATPAATPANFGDPFEGGFYAGMIWNQIARSSTSKALSTGTHTFTVPSMSGSPIVYQGQMVEVRSRSNPSNKFVGTVSNAVGTELTITVTSVVGSGTYSDWSVMSRFRVIVAPKSLGENSSIPLKNTDTSFPSACKTLSEGWLATEAMRAADTSTVYPAAHWARSLSIGGKTDWYIPARDELELLWRNLKPTTESNYIGYRLSSSYSNNGSYRDSDHSNGLNNNSYPVGDAYTQDVPAQTSSAAFHSGGVEALTYATGAVYFSSTESSSSRALVVLSQPSVAGLQDLNSKSVSFSVRAVRRSVI